MENVKTVGCGGGADMVKELVALGAKGVGIFNVPLDCAKGTPHLLVPDGFTLERLELDGMPDRKRVKVDLYDMGSFIEYINEHKGIETRIFARCQNPPYVFTAVIDYHCPDAAGNASLCTHIATLTMTETDAWKEWFGNNAKPIGQMAFAEFIEANQLDIIEPDGAKVLEMALNFENTSQARFKSAARLSNGNVHLEYACDNNAKVGPGGSMDVPDQIKLRITPFVGMPPSVIDCRLRYRVSGDGVLSFSYHMIRPKDLIDRVVKEAAGIVRVQTDRPVFMGTYLNQ